MRAQLEAFLPVFLATTLTMGCGHSGVPLCTPGLTVSCSCAGAVAGRQSCERDGRYGPCDCKTPPTPGSQGNHPDMAPRILSLGAQVNRLTVGESLSITAVVTDPDGIDDLIGGSLTDPTGSSQYAPFASAAQEGAYGVTLTWAQLNATAPIAFDGPAVREFVAHFFDVAGHETRGSIKITLHCDGRRGAACNGVCTDLSSDAVHCGTCGSKCDYRCHNRSCVSAPATVLGANTPRSCLAICQAAAKACVSECALTLGQFGDYLSTDPGTGAGVAKYDCASNGDKVLRCNDVPSATTYEEFGGTYSKCNLKWVNCCCR